jgi:hypothetical protein
MTGETDCLAQSGTYQGGGTDCADIICPSPGDDCGLPSDIPALSLADLPWSHTSTTCGRGNTYDAQTIAHCLLEFDSGEDMIYALTVTEPMNVSIKLDPHGMDHTAIAIGDACPPTLSCLGRSISPPQAPHRIENVPLEPGTTYYIQVDTWDPPSCIPQFTLTVEQYVPCELVCPAGSVIEGEPACYNNYFDVYNAGCNRQTPVFTSIQLGDTVCGEFGTFEYDFSASRDTDWYEFTTTEPMTFTWTLEAERPALWGFIETLTPGSGDCGDRTGYVYPYLITGRCDPNSIVTECLPAGTYWLFVAPGGETPCGTPYQFTIEGTPCVIPTGACCITDGSCIARQTQRACDDVAGHWQGEGTRCNPNPCEPFPCETCYTMSIEWITQVAFNTIYNNSDPGGDECAYADYTHLSTDVVPGETYPLTVTFSSASYVEYVRAWIDWDQSITFDPDEAIDVGTGVSTTVTTDVTVPLDAVPGPVHMRVIVHHGEYAADPCGVQQYGEPEDYTVIVTSQCGDLDGDRDVDGDDYAAFLAAYGACTGDANYVAAADLDESGCIDVVDYLQWVQCYRDYAGNPAAPLPVAKLGDFDLDGDVDMDDYEHLSACLGGAGVAPAVGCLDTDVTADGDTDLADFAAFATAFGL